MGEREGGVSLFRIPRILCAGSLQATNTGGTTSLPMSRCCFLTELVGVFVSVTNAWVNYSVQNINENAGKHHERGEKD